mmetsp:Transcript_6026/g.16795  ORF Transcript_6026/g.16795 Transcript_6026/m.16795 type:complete len:338 (+) Transcript_6026:168-1181(+)
MGGESACAGGGGGVGELRHVDNDTVQALRSKLLDNTLPLAARYRALYALRSSDGSSAVQALKTAMDPKAVPSALLRHDVAFCLGQRRDAAAIATLVEVLGDSAEHPMVRHEAGEALGAICTEPCLEPLRAHLEDPCQEVAETCQLAVQRVEYFAERNGQAGADAATDPSPYASVDPTPAAPSSVPVDELRRMLLDEKEKMFERYRALFALRNRGGKEACQALADAFGSSSALLKHEIAYVLGQMLDSSTTTVLVKVLQDHNEAAMVRHEAAEALGAIAEPWTYKMLKEYSQDSDPIVADSCIVALDMLAHEESGTFEYADTGADTSIEHGREVQVAH